MEHHSCRSALDVQPRNAGATPLAGTLRLSCPTNNYKHPDSLALVGNDKAWNAVRADHYSKPNPDMPVPPLWQERFAYPALQLLLQTYL